MKKLLLLEDDPVLGKGLKLLFELEDFSVLWAQSVREAEEIVKDHNLSIAILDVGLPDGSGIDFCAWLRKFKHEFPVIMLTAQTDEESVVKGLMSGANDYVKKPFSNKELIARVLVNTKNKASSSTITIGHLEINEQTRRISYKQQEIKFNRKEFEILCLFAKNLDVIISREKIIERVLDNIEINDRTVDSHISHIRSKLSKAKIQDIMIKSEYGVGYRLKLLC